MRCSGMDVESPDVVLHEKSAGRCSGAHAEVCSLHLKLAAKARRTLESGRVCRGESSETEGGGTIRGSGVEQYRLDNERCSNAGTDHGGGLGLRREHRHLIKTWLAAAVIEPGRAASPGTGSAL